MLKDADERFRNISITHDMTKSDREQCKEMVQQAIEKRAADNRGSSNIWLKVLRGA